MLTPNSTDPLVSSLYGMGEAFKSLSNGHDQQKPKPNKADVEREVARLLKCDPTDYVLQLAETAKQLGIGKGDLEKLVKAKRPTPEDALRLPDTESWPEEVDGADLLNEATAAFKRYVILPEGSADILALWALHSHCFRLFLITPRAAIISPEKGCGKTTTLDVLRRLVARPLAAENATVAAIFRTVEQHAPTLLLDELDTFLSQNEELRGLLNSGHRRGGQVLRVVGDDHTPKAFSTFCPLAFGMIGTPPDTLYDRSIVIKLRRKKPFERVRSLREGQTEDLEILACKMARWAADHGAAVAERRPDMSPLENRQADNWSALFAIAEEVGGNWIELVRQFAIADANNRDEQSIGAMLLGDIRDVFDRIGDDRLPSAELACHLTSLEHRPWAEWKGRPMTAAALARQLTKFNIIPVNIRLGDKVPKGYHRRDFEEAFATYLAPKAVHPPYETATPLQSNNDGHCSAFKALHGNGDVAV